MVVKGRKLIALAAMVAVVGTLLLTSTTPVMANNTYSRHAQAKMDNEYLMDFWSNVAGAAIGGALSNTAAIAAAIGGSAAAGAVGAVVGYAIAVGCPYAYSAATFCANTGLSQLYLASSAPPIVGDVAMIPSTALDL
jgi:hypothetical protein